MHRQNYCDYGCGAKHQNRKEDQDDHRDLGYQKVSGALSIPRDGRRALCRLIPELATLTAEIGIQPQHGTPRFRAVGAAFCDMLLRLMPFTRKRMANCNPLPGSVPDGI